MQKRPPPCRSTAIPVSGEFIDDDVTLSYCVTYPPCEGLQSAYAATDQNLENMCAAQPVVPVAFVGVCRVAGASLRQCTGYLSFCQSRLHP